MLMGRALDMIVDLDGKLFALAETPSGGAEVVVFDPATKSWVPSPVFVSTLMEDGRTPSPALLAEAGLAAS
jgi:hypothetical protein